MKKLLRMIAALAAAALVLCAVPCYATSGATVTGETITTTAGRDIEYRVSISGNPGLIGYRLKIRYDTSALSLVSCTQGDFTASGTTTCGETDGGCNILWYHTSDIASDGTLFVLKLHVDEAAALGTYPIAVSSDAGYSINKAEEPVPLNCVSGSVTVREFVPKICGDICSAAQGEELLYSVYLEDNPGIASYHIQMTFDPNVLEYADAQPGDETVQLPTDGFSGSFQKHFYSNAFEAIWYNQSNVTDEGTLFSLRLRVKDAAALGESPVTVLIVPGDTLDANEQPVQFECTDGAVTVEREINVVFPDAVSATVTISGAKGQLVIAALYAPDGRQLAAAVKGIDDRDATLQLVSTIDGKTCETCKIMTLDSSYRPICDAISVVRAA